MDSARHVLSLSGGKDSAALAVYMRDRVPEMEYLFHDTGKELPETYDYLSRLEAILGKTITRSTSDQSFDTWLSIFGGMIPSNHRRWCTRYLKVKPFEDYIGDDPVYNYIGIRADEDRVGYISHKPNIIPVYPFRDDQITRADVIRILEESGLGLPPYMAWGRTRSGCYFCFYQQKIEWVRLKQVHPELFEKAKEYEHANKVNGEAFYWNGRESLDDIERPERIREIEENWERLHGHPRRTAKNRPLIQVLAADTSADDEDDEREGCLICSL